MMNNTGKHIIEHFSHEHPLIFNDEANLDSDDIKPKFCSICGLIFFINSYYSCSRIEQGCHFLLHQQCAHRLPKELRAAPWFNPSKYDDDYTFSLGGPKDPVIANETCLKCGQICKNYTYSNRYLGHIHPWCGVPLEIVTKHGSHGHRLSPTRREICGVCNACGDEERGIFLSCQACDYWISHDCALLPPVTIHASHSHPLTLFYNNLDFERSLVTFGLTNCDICGGPIGYKSFYSCESCQCYVHLKCIKLSIKNITPEESRKYIVHLPAANKEDTIFSSLIANLEQDEEVDATSMSITMSTTEEFHKHQLIFHGTSIVDEVVDDLEEGQKWESKALCNACINPINSSTPYYRCSVDQCHFLVHEFCAKLPSRIKDKYFDSSTWFLFTKWKEFFSVFRCHFCQYDCNGFGYSTESEWSSKGMCVDVECACAPRIIKHESHKNHYLQLKRLKSKWGFPMPETKCCFTTHLSFSYYRCTNCPGFTIHQHCALLPREVRHKFDKHPLRLITDGGNLAGRSMESDREYLKNCGFCEVCEKPMHPCIWFYYCSECDHYLHVDCIPSVGKLSKLKFGGTLDHVGCHDHPVTCVRMLTIGSQSCTYCKNIIQGFEDDWAFHCESCDVWIHNYCARKSVDPSIEKSESEADSSEKNNSESDVDSSEKNNPVSAVYSSEKNNSESDVDTSEKNNPVSAVDSSEKNNSESDVDSSEKNNSESDVDSS